MKSFWTKATVAVAAILCAGAAGAATIDFESVDTTNAPFAPLLSDQDYVTSLATASEPTIRTTRAVRTARWSVR